MAMLIKYKRIESIKARINPIANLVLFLIALFNNIKGTVIRGIKGIEYQSISPIKSLVSSVII